MSRVRLLEATFALISKGYIFKFKTALKKSEKRNYKKITFKSQKVLNKLKSTARLAETILISQ